MLSIANTEAGTLRTNWTNPKEFLHRDMTAIEMAREMGYSHLYNILSPIIRHNLPPMALHCLQKQFHDIIRTDLGLQGEANDIRLPELVVLTELEVPEMWFPLKPPDSTGLKVINLLKK